MTSDRPINRPENAVQRRENRGSCVIPSLRNLFIALSVSAAFSLPAMAQSDALSEAQKLLKAGQTQQALDKIDTYIVSKPKDAQGRFLKGVILTEMNRGSDAIGIFAKLTEDYPELPEPYNNLAVLYAQQKQYDKARAALEMAIRTHPAYAIAHENLGDVYAKLASQAYDKALQLDSSNAAASTKLSMIRDLIGGKPTAKGGKTAEPVRVAAAEPKPTPVKPVATQPAPASSAPPNAAVPPPVAAPSKPAAMPTAGNPKADIESTIRQWAAAWSKKDIAAYLAHYARDFDPPGKTTRAAWEVQRQQRVTKPGQISIDLSDFEVTLLSEKSAKARFRQAYRSANFQSDSVKTLSLVQEGNAWRIREEEAR